MAFLAVDLPIPLVANPAKSGADAERKLKGVDVRRRHKRERKLRRQRKPKQELKRNFKPKQTHASKRRRMRGPRPLQLKLKLKLKPKQNGSV